MKTSDYLWEDKYAPLSIKDYRFQSDAIRDEVLDIIHKKNLPSLLFSGVQGTGKSTLAKVLLHEFKVDRIDQLIINASRDRGIDVVRDKISEFCKTYPMGDIKVILLEEADGLTRDSQDALRSIMDEYKASCRFIFTCNNESKIIPPLKSRCREIRMNAFSKDALMECAIDILEKEKIEVDNLDILEQHVELFYPDLRKIIISLQQSSATGKLTALAENSYLINSPLDQWKDQWHSSEPVLKTLVALANSGNIDQQNYDRYYRVMYENHTNLPLDKQQEAVVIIAEHLYKAAFVADQEINMVACLYRIFEGV
jgi:DNA polymerase III delta prime subunit